MWIYVLQRGVGDNWNDTCVEDFVLKNKGAILLKQYILFSILVMFQTKEMHSESQCFKIEEDNIGRSRYT